MGMKFKFRDRLLLVVCGVLGLLLALVVATLTAYGLRTGIPPVIQVLDLRFGAVFASLNYWIWGLLALLMLLVSVWMLRLAFRREPKHDKGSVSLQNTENGNVRISVQAIDMLVKRAIGNTEGVVDVKTRVVNHEDSITVMVDMTLDSDVHIPNTTVLMQRSIKNFIEEYSGIAVREVTILVSKIIEVTPHPPLQLESQMRVAPQVIDVPDAIEPEVAEAAAAAAEAAAAEQIEMEGAVGTGVFEPVATEPDATEVAEDTEVSEATEVVEASDEDDADAPKDGVVSEKDIW